MERSMTPGTTAPIHNELAAHTETIAVSVEKFGSGSRVRWAGAGAWAGAAATG